MNIVRLSETPGQGSFAGKALQYAEQAPWPSPFFRSAAFEAGGRREAEGWSLACRDAASIEYKSGLLRASAFCRYPQHSGLSRIVWAARGAAKYWQAEALICVGRHQQALNLGWNRLAKGRIHVSVIVEWT